MKKAFAVAMSLLATLAFAAFDESHFNYGRQWKGELKGVNLSGKGLSHLAIWLGDNATYNTYWEGDMVRACSQYDLTPVIYAYVIAEYDKDQGYKDCDMGTPNHCTNGAQTIRDHWSDILARYKSYAQGIAQDYGTSKTTVWLIEPDFFQYSVSGDNHETRFSQVGGGIPDAELCGTYFNDIVAAIKQYLPNAKIAVDISPWLNEEIITWYANFDRSKVDYLFSSGGRTQGDQSRIRSDNNNNVTWAYASAAMGGKKIIADDGYGVGGGTEDNYDDWTNVNNLNARIADGVIGITIQDPDDSYYTFAAQHPISLGGGGGNSSSSTAQSSSSRPSSSSAAPTPSNLTALIDNFEDGDEISEWGGEWTTYTDAGDGGQSTITTSYSTGYSSSKALKASYTLRKGTLNYDPQVGISVDLLADKSAVNLNSCTSISYYYKGAAHAVRMESPLVTDYAYHQANVDAANNWTKKTVALTSMTQPDWSKISVNVNSARQSVKAFSWQVSGTNGSTGSLEIDNVRCEGLPEPISSSSSAKSSSSVSSSSARSSSSVSSSSVSSSSVSSSSVSSSSISSSSVSSSSMGGPCIAFVNGTADYGEHCYNSGLNDMEEGKCYTMNPERSPTPQWINGSVTETYWWVETSCGEEESSSSSEQISSSSAIPTYTITFKNGNVTLATVVLEAGSMPAYTGETPTKEPTDQYSYTFSGWEPALATVTGDAVYTAKFDPVLNYYAIQFFNGTELLKTESVAYGTTPVYSGATPTKDEDAGYTYAFDGWTPDLAPVTQAADYVAKFKGTKKKYTVTFVDDDLTTVLKAAEEYDFGTLAANIVQPATPTKAANAEYTYQFSGWSPKLVDVVDNITYVATYAETKRKYPVTFVDEDGTILQATAQYDYGTVPANIAKPANPTKEGTAGETFTFAGWTPAIVTVTEDAVYTATYTSSTNSYTVTFKDEDGTVLSTASYPYGTAAASIALPANPTKAATAEFTYEFSGWDPKIADVTGNATYAATYKSFKRKYTITYLNEDGSVFTKAEYEYGTPAKSLQLAENPTKKASAQYTYAFAGWNPTLAKVTGEATYTATFDAMVNKYSVTFKDEDGTVLLAAAEYDYGTVPADIAKPADPVKQGTAGETFAFAGWTPALAAVTEDVVYTATYTSSTNSYTVTFVKDDGTVIHTATYPYGTAAAGIAQPQIPEKPATAEYTYEFSGWSPKIENVTGNATYTATYTSAKNQYTVTFVNGDGTRSTQEVEYGETPVAPAGKTPANDAQYSYTFAGWTPEIVPVTGKATYTAVVNRTVNKYSVTFKDEDGTVLLAAADYDYGTVPADIAKPADPVKQGTAGETFAFAGWTPALAAVTEDVVYTATYTSSTNSYTVTFVKDDGTVIYTATYPYGTAAASIVQPRIPEKPATEEYTYEFSGWSPKIENVTGNATYTATYKSFKRKYTITYLNEDGSVFTKAEYEYGTPAKSLYLPENPSKKATDQYTYTFAGWTPTLTQVTGEATYTATFKATVNQYTVTFLNYDNSKLQSSKVAYGEMPEYMGETPVKPSTATYNYFFDYWTPSIESVTEDVSYMAVFREEAVVIPSSSSVVESSSSEEHSSSSEVVESSSSEEQSSSSEVVESSSSEEQSSSSEVVESSSSEEQPSSSEVVEESSSSEAESSSSEVVDESSSSEESSNSGAESSSSVEESPCIAFVNGVGGYAEHCYNSGLNNMTAETCYTISPTRPGSLQWMNTDASNREWWAETSCFDFVPPSSSSATTIVSSSSSATAPETFVAELQSQLKVSFAHNCLAIYAPRESLVRVQVFDMLGNRVKTFQETFAGSRDVSLQGLPQGSYMVRVVSGNSAKTSRINIR